MPRENDRIFRHTTKDSSNGCLERIRVASRINRCANITIHNGVTSYQHTLFLQPIANTSMRMTGSGNHLGNNVSTSNFRHPPKGLKQFTLTMIQERARQFHPTPIIMMISDWCRISIKEFRQSIDMIRMSMGKPVRLHGQLFPLKKPNNLPAIATWINNDHPALSPQQNAVGRSGEPRNGRIHREYFQLNAVHRQ